MSRIQHSRLSSAIIFALLCINSSLAIPLANADHSPVSIVDAVEPVNIIDIEDLSRDPMFPADGSTTTNDGTTVTTTYNNPRDVVQKRKPKVSIVAAFEPVNVIPSDDFTHSRQLGSDNGSTSSSTTTTNDGTTVTTTYPTNQRNLLQTNPNVTGSLDLINLKNHTRQLSEIDMGLNCQGSVIMCVGANQMGVMHTLRDYMYAIPTGYRYYTGQDIACMKHSVYPSPIISWGFYCAFMQGNIPAEGVDGTLIQLKMQQMIEHHCLGCGSVPFSDDNDPRTLGVLTVNYVRLSECEGLCYYKPPGTAADAVVKVPKGMTLAT